MQGMWVMDVYVDAYLFVFYDAGDMRVGYFEDAMNIGAYRSDPTSHTCCSSPRLALLLTQASTNGNMLYLCNTLAICFTWLWNRAAISCRRLRIEHEHATVMG